MFADVAEVQQTLVWDTGNVHGVPTPSSHVTAEQASERARRRAEFGATVRRLRQAAGMTQEQLGLAAGLDRPFLVQIEGGKRSLLVERLEDLAGALGVNSAELLVPSSADDHD